MLTETYEEQIMGIISCYDRIIIQGTLPGWCYDQGMTSYLYSKGIRIFDFPQFAHALKEEIRDNASKIAADNGLEIEFIRKIKAFRKDDRIKEIIKQRGEHPGLVHIFSAMETCTSYKPWHDKNTGQTYLRYDSGKCLHYYFYFIDQDLGLCYLRVPTWLPFRLQFYFNGHNLLASKLKKEGLGYVMKDNAFLEIDDFEKAQELSDKIRVENLHKILDILAKRYCPVIEKHQLSYRWSIMQVEYATDIIFKKQSDLKPLYDNLVKTAIHSVNPENIATFLGKKLHLNYQGEMGNNFNTRIQGTRIKHQMGAVSIKMYDKFGIILRIETSSNDVSQFQHYREVQHRNGEVTKKIASMKKNIYSLFPLAGLLKASNRRYLEFISSFDDPTKGVKNLNKVTRNVEVNSRNYKGLNFFNEEDLDLLHVLAKGEYNIYGLRNQVVRQHLPWSSGKVSRILKRLRVHGLIKKVGGTYKYYLTKLGKQVIATGLYLKEMLIIPQLTNA